MYFKISVLVRLYSVYIDLIFNTFRNIFLFQDTDMTMTESRKIAQQTGIAAHQIENVLALMAEGATIPFIARYRKEKTGSLDEVQLAAIRDQAESIQQLEKRRTAIIESLTGLNLYQGQLKEKIDTSATLQELEDHYLPHRPKRKTKAVMAKEKGLEPLARSILFQQQNLQTTRYINKEKAVSSEENALTGALDIIAEHISEDIKTRNALRLLFKDKGLIQTEKKKSEDDANSKFRDYFTFSQPVKRIAGHQLLAILRGESQKALKLTARPEEQTCIGKIAAIYNLRSHRYADLMESAITDSYKRLLAPSLETELINELKENAEEEAIDIFGKNLQQLLLAPPLGQVATMGVDPGFRTGAKIACLDSQGQLLNHATIYPTHGEKQQAQAAQVINDFIRQHSLRAVAIGNGTASRETEEFIKRIIEEKDTIVTMVNEDGASIYSASETARKEFPDLDLTIRGAISIGRRLQDPLAELVKIDPKSLGIGQYQHDVNQTKLKKKLDDVVSYCVNRVGVELNSASAELLSFVSGIGPVIAKNIVQYRNESGPFQSRKALLKVPRLGAKCFQQCAGFLRVSGSKNPLDNSGVHPEQYSVVEQIASDLGIKVVELVGKMKPFKQIDLHRYKSETTGLETLNDILLELDKPGRDPREEFELFSFSEHVQSINDLHEGMTINGVITNITQFGAFVDIGVHHHGLIHVSELANRFVKDPAEIVSLNQKVKVLVISVDLQRNRIGLSLKQVPQ